MQLKAFHRDISLEEDALAGLLPGGVVLVEEAVARQGLCACTSVLSDKFFVHRPCALKAICIYQKSMHFKSINKSFINSFLETDTHTLYFYAIDT